jgi:SAM-dependent methyltransferase
LDQRPTDDILSETQRRTLVAIAAALAERLATMGEDASGLHNYYARKLRHGALLGECDLQALQTLRQRVGQFRRVWEVGSGVGQLTAMLALDGHDIVAIDRDPRRHAAMTAALDVLERHDAAARRRVATRLGSFPAVLDETDDVRADAVLVLGCTFTAAEPEYRAFTDALPHFAFGLIDFPRLFVETKNSGDWCERARDFAERYRVAAVPVANYEIPEEGKRGELFLIGGRRDSQP